MVSIHLIILLKSILTSFLLDWIVQGEKNVLHFDSLSPASLTQRNVFGDDRNMPEKFSKDVLSHSGLELGGGL